MRRTALRSVVVSLAAVVGAGALAGCAATVSEAPRHAGKPSYAIACMEISECDRAARRHCGGAYSTLHRWQNQIPDSELPGLNARTRRNAERSTREYDHWDWDPSGPGIESEEPLPIAELLVVCG